MRKKGEQGGKEGRPAFHTASVPLARLLSPVLCLRSQKRQKGAWPQTTREEVTWGRGETGRETEKGTVGRRGEKLTVNEISQLTNKKQ